MADQVPNTAQRLPPLYPQATIHTVSSTPSGVTPLQSPLSPGTGLSNSGPNSRPSSGPGPLQSQHLSLAVGAVARSTGYVQSYHSIMTPPGVSLPGYAEIGHPPHGSLVPNMYPDSNPTTAGLQGQKRAYRQRRKDPSCDACRERKVKVSTNVSALFLRTNIYSATPLKVRAVQNVLVGTSNASSLRRLTGVCPISGQCPADVSRLCHSDPPNQTQSGPSKGISSCKVTGESPSLAPGVRGRWKSGPRCLCFGLSSPNPPV